MTDKFSPFKVATYLDTDRACAYFITAVLDDGGVEDPAVLVNAIQAVAQARGLPAPTLLPDSSLPYVTVAEELAKLGLRLTVEPARAIPD